MADTKKHFDVRTDVIDKSPLTRMFVIIGQRGVGKTYSVKREVIKNFLNNDKKFVYCRRWTTEITARNLTYAFSDMDMKDKEFDYTKYDPNGAFVRFHIMGKSNIFYLVGEDKDGKLTWLTDCGIAVCLSQAETVKGMALNADFDEFFFDEFISERRYLEKETELFSKIINTIGRAGTDLKIFLCGNPDASIEGNPYLTGLFKKLRVSYSKLEPNTIYYFDSKDGKKTLPKNICFVKLANFDGTFLNSATSSLFEDSAEEEMSRTGEVKTYKYIHIDDLSDFRPFYCLIVETPIYTETDYHKKIYAYYGEMWGEPVCVVMGHNKLKGVVSLYCRYEETDFRPREYRQTYRIRVPQEEGFADLRRLVTLVDNNRLIICDTDENATLYENIRLNS